MTWRKGPPPRMSRFSPSRTAAEILHDQVTSRGKRVEEMNIVELAHYTGTLFNLVQARIDALLPGGSDEQHVVDHELQADERIKSGARRERRMDNIKSGLVIGAVVLLVMFSGSLLLPAVARFLGGI